MKTQTIRSTLMATLGLVIAMLVTSGALGMLPLQRANDGLAGIRALAAETTEINDVYQDASRARSSLTRAYADASLRRTLDHFRAGRNVDGMDPALSGSLDKAIAAQRADDIAAYMTINLRKVDGRAPPWSQRFWNG